MLRVLKYCIVCANVLGYTVVPADSVFLCVSLHSVIIPSAEQIAAARRQRSAHRAQREFIPLSKDGQRSRGSTPDHHSRDGDDDEERVDDDEDDEPDDCERRIEFAPRLKSIRERIAEKLGMRGKKGEGVGVETEGRRKATVRCI